jgi:hypothetical protein
MLIIHYVLAKSVIRTQFIDGRKRVSHTKHGLRRNICVKGLVLLWCRSGGPGARDGSFGSPPQIGRRFSVVLPPH